jgi:hypothetical protein
MATVRSTYANINNGRWELCTHIYIYIYIHYMYIYREKKERKGYRQTNTIAIIKYRRGIYIFFNTL